MKPFLHAVRSFAEDGAEEHFRSRLRLGILTTAVPPSFAFMFTLLRSVAIIGLIFYLSPARETDQSQRHTGEERKPAQAPAPLPAEDPDSAWNRLVGNLKEEVVRTAVNDKALTDKALSAGLRVSENAARSLVAPSKPTPPERPRLADPGWTLRPAEDPSVRCVYRCDGSE